MTSTPPAPESPESHDDEAGRLRRAIRADVAEARAIEPLVADARAVQLSVRARLKRALPLIGLVSLGAVLIFSGLYKSLNVATLSHHHAVIAGWVNTHPLMTALAMVIALAGIISTGLPGGVVIVLAMGVFFGAWRGAIMSVMGDTMGATALYFAARYFFMVEGARPPALVERIRGGFQRNPTSFALFIRLVPVFPYGPASVALAWLGCRLPLFLGATVAGAIPISYIFTSFGAGVSKTLAEQRPISLDILTEPRFLIPLIAFAVLSLLPALLGLRKSPAASDPPPPAT